MLAGRLNRNVLEERMVTYVYAWGHNTFSHTTHWVGLTQAHPNYTHAHPKELPLPVIL